MKKILMLFSGGLDSTYLLYKNLKEGHNVNAVYIQIRNNISQYKTELIAIKHITKYITKNFDNFKFCDKSNYELCGPFECILQQVPGHIFQLLSCITNTYDEVQIGYISNDYAISYLDDIKKIYYSYQSLFYFKLPKLTFPLSKTKKYTAYKELPEELKNYICFCPNSVYKNNKIIPCGNCIKCQDMKNVGKYDFNNKEIENRYFKKNKSKK